jgi:NTP pyrophosphatase (non-canonical NTP hydrolase)
MKTQQKVIQWAYERNLIHPENAIKQIQKLSEEIGELMGSILKQKREQEIDAFGDIYVVLIILCEQTGHEFPKRRERIVLHEDDIALWLIRDLGDIAEYYYASQASFKTELEYFYTSLCLYAEHRGIHLEKALDLAYETIKDRTGKLIDGSFVKDEI